MKKLENNSKYTSLLVLDLSRESLKEIPEDVLRYVNLKELNVSHNQIKYLPDFLKELQFLETINISHNKLTTFPNVVINFKELRNLDISSNAINNLKSFEGIKVLSKLEALNISENTLEDLPSGIWKLTNLKELNVSGIEIQNISKEIGSLRNLESLYVQNCKILSLPSSIGYLKKLTELQVSGNLLEQLPDTFKHLIKLEKLNLSNNLFKSFSTVFFELNNLEHLNISGNLIGKLPKNINTLKKLKYLNISRNKMKGLPLSFFKLQLKKEDFLFKGNVFSRTTQVKIKKMFASAQNKSTSTNNFEVKETIKENETEEVVDKSDTGSSQLLFLKWGIPLTVICLIFIFSNKDSKENNANQSVKPYMQVIEELRHSFRNVLDTTKEVYVYTNDTVKLNMIINVNASFKEDDFIHRYSDENRAEIISAFLDDKSQGFTVILNNKREKIHQMHVYDSIIPNDSVKLFKISAYFKLTPKERKNSRKMEEMQRRLYGGKEKKDTVFGVRSGVVSFDELKNEKIDDFFKAMSMPTYINLNREDYCFYFSPYNANVTKQEFKEAVTLFNKMFIKKGNPKKSCTIKTLRVKKYYSRLTNN